jgi:hypothetical protein
LDLASGYHQLKVAQNCSSKVHGFRDPRWSLSVHQDPIWPYQRTRSISKSDKQHSRTIPLRIRTCLPGSDELKRRVRARVPVATSIPELMMVAVEEEWHNIPQERIVNLIRSVLNRMQGKLLLERGEVIRGTKIKELLL